MYYRINVALGGMHHFATSETSLTDPKRAKQIYHQLKEAFPKSRGYKVTIAYWQTTGVQIDPNDLQPIIN